MGILLRTHTYIQTQDLILRRVTVTLDIIYFCVIWRCGYINLFNASDKRVARARSACVLGLNPTSLKKNFNRRSWYIYELIIKSTARTSINEETVHVNYEFLGFSEMRFHDVSRHIYYIITFAQSRSCNPVWDFRRQWWKTEHITSSDYSNRTKSMSSNQLNQRVKMRVSKSYRKDKIS